MKRLFECIKCDTQLELETDDLDITVRCPGCGRLMEDYYTGLPVDEIEPISVGKRRDTL